MIEISNLVAALRARSAFTRIMERETAWELARARYDPAPGDIVPNLTAREQQEDYNRIRKLVKSVGERALHVKVTAAIGSVSWGDDTPTNAESMASFRASKDKADKALEPLKLPEMARKLAESWNVDGIIAVHPYLDRVSGKPKLSRLTGYLEPYLNPRNMDEINGLYQAKSFIDGRGRKKWWVRVYDWEGMEKATVREWQDLDDPLNLGHMPTFEAKGAEIPAVRVGALTDEGLVMSRFLASMPLMLAIMATELSLERTRELAAYPIPVFKNATEVSVVSPAVPVQVEDNGDFYFAEPGNLEQLQKHLENRQARFNSDLNLPAGFIGGNRSGESIREENISFYTDARNDARVVSEVLTEGVEGYARIADGVEAVPVGVSPNLEYMRDMMIQGIVLLHDKGLLPAEVAMREVQVFFPTYSDEELQRAIEQRQTLVTPEDAVRALGGGDASA